MSLSATAHMMGMPVNLRITDHDAAVEHANAVFGYLLQVDRRFSTFLPESETERINREELHISDASPEMRTVADLCEKTRLETDGYFNSRYGGRFDPLGVVKGYAIEQAAKLLESRGLCNFFIEAGGDIQTSGCKARGEKWRVGIRNPFERNGIISIVELSGEGVATSGTYERGRHIYDPVHRRIADSVASVTVIAESVCDADRFATAAFAMGSEGIQFLQRMPRIEGCVINLDGTALCTGGFERFLSADSYSVTRHGWK